MFYQRVGIRLAVFFLVGLSVLAQSPGSPAVPATGQNVTNGRDNGYQVVADTTGQIAPPAAAILITSLAFNWAAIPGAVWIGPSADQSNATRGPCCANTSDTYRTTFTISGSPAGAALNLTVAADDYVDVLLNGAPVFTHTSTNMWETPAAFSITSGFVTGTNTLDFVVTNMGGPTGLAVTQTWSTLSNQPPGPVGLCMLLTDGGVMCQNSQTLTGWYKLTPDPNGSYSDGKWSSLASLPSTYAPDYFASAVLADGRVVIVGGEYILASGQFNFVLSNLGAIYDPQANTWTMLASPPSTGSPNHFQCIGDAPATVLANGNLIIGSKLYQDVAMLNPTTLTWSIVSATGKTDGFSSEEGWMLLADGSFFTLDVKNAPSSERFFLTGPTTGVWVNAGSTLQDLATPPDTSPVTPGAPGCPSYTAPGEIGPTLLRPDGTVFAIGGDGFTGIYTPPAVQSPPSSTAGAWTQGPQVPFGLHIEDGPGAVLPSGHVLFGASPPDFGTGLQYFEFDGATLTSVAAPANAPSDATFQTSLLVLPTGQVMFSDFSSTVQLYNPADSQPQTAWAPTISSVPLTMNSGATYQISGTQFNGLSQGSAYGDEMQNASNYPLVRIINSATGHVFYAKTHNHSTMGVATGTTPVSTNFDVPANIEGGASTIQVVANGIPSAPLAITIVVPAPVLTISKTHTGNFTQGQTGAQYTVIVANSGNLSTSLPVTVTETVPAGLTLVSMSGSGWTCTVNTSSCTRPDALLPGSSFSAITVTANVASNAPSTVTNLAAVASGPIQASAQDPTDINPPAPTTVTNVTSSTPGGTYGMPSLISIQVSFSGTVTVTGAPQLALNSNGRANYTSGSGSATLNFTYAIGATDSSSHLDYASTGALTLNGGTIKDAAGNNANLTLPAPGTAGSLGANAAFLIGMEVSPPPASFFTGEVYLGSGVYFLRFPDGNPFGYYNFPGYPILYHYQMGFEGFVDGGGGAAYLYDFTSGHWWYTGSSLFPYLYDFTLNNWLYYFPDPTNNQGYTTNPRSFANLTTGKIFTM